MYGKYSPESTVSISSGRTEKAKNIVSDHGGEIRDMYALMAGEHDLVLIVELPDISKAIKASVDLFKETGIQFTTVPAMDVSDFDQMMEG